MNFKVLNVIFLGLLLAFLNGCGKQQKVDELLKQGEQAREDEDYEQAEEDFSQAIGADSKSAKAFASRGSLFVITGEFTNAIRDLTEALRLNPDEKPAREMLGYAYYGNEQLDAALTNFNIVLQKEPDNGRVLKMRGQTYYWKKNFPNAIADLTGALKFSTNDPEIYADRGDAYFIEKNLDKALDDFNDAIRLDPEDSSALFGRGRIYDKQKKYAEAVEDFQSVIRLKPRAFRAYNLEAWLLATCPDDKVRDGKRAVKIGMKACELSKWEDYAYVDTLAAAYAEAGDFEQAVKYQRQAAGMDGIPADNLTGVQSRIELYLQHKPYRISTNAYD